MWAIYARVSTPQQKKEGTSLNAQEIAGKNYCKQNKITDYKIYKEQVSGASLTRIKFLEMIRDIKDGKISNVWIHKIDRLARRVLVSAEFRELLIEHKIPLIEEGVKYHLWEEGDSLNYGIRSEFAEHEKKAITRRMREGLDRKIYAGGQVYQSMYGYDYSFNEIGKRVITINEREASIVKEIFTRVKNNESFFSIAQDLTNRGCYNNKASQFWTSYIKKTINKKIYTGFYDYKDVKDIQSYMYEPIISKDLFDEVQALQNESYKRMKAWKYYEDKGEIRYSQHLGTGFIHCPYCGESTKYCGEKSYYKQGKYTINPRYSIPHKKTCDRPKEYRYGDSVFFQPALDRWIEIQVIKFLESKENMWNLYKNEKEEFSKNKEHKNEEINILKDEINKLRKRKKQLLSFDLDDEDIQNEIVTISKKQKQKEQYLIELDISLSTSKKELDTLLTQLIKTTLDTWIKADIAQKRNMLQLWVRKCEVIDHEIHLEWITGQKVIFPFKTKKWWENWLENNNRNVANNNEEMNNWIKKIENVESDSELLDIIEEIKQNFNDYQSELHEASMKIVFSNLIKTKLMDNPEVKTKKDILALLND